MRTGGTLPPSLPSPQTRQRTHGRNGGTARRVTSKTVSGKRRSPRVFRRHFFFRCSHSHSRLSSLRRHDKKSSLFALRSSIYCAVSPEFVGCEPLSGVSATATEGDLGASNPFCFSHTDLIRSPHPRRHRQVISHS